MHSEAADLDAVFAGDSFDERGFACDFDELFAGVAVLVEGADVTRGHGAREGDGDGVLDWRGRVSPGEGDRVGIGGEEEQGKGRKVASEGGRKT